MKHFPIPHNESQRLKTLVDYHILDTNNDAQFDRLAELAAIICNVPISLVSFIDARRQWVKSSMGIEIDEASRDLSFCQYTIMSKVLFEVEDALKDERFKDSAFVKDNPHIRFYAGYPLIEPGGYAIGTICVLDTKPQKLSDGQKHALSLLAAQATDLTVNQRKQDELRYFEGLFELSNDLICILGYDGYFKKVNRAFEEVLGWDRRFLLTTHISSFIHSDGFSKMYDELELLRTGKPTIGFLQKFKAKDGSYLDLQWVATPEPGTDNLFAIARNVTEEKQQEEKLRASEDKFRSFFENSQGLMCTHDLEGNFLTVNPAGACLLGYTVEEAERMNLRALIPVEYHSKLENYLSEIRQKGKSSGLMTSRHIDGTRCVWSYNNILIQDQNGRFYVIGNSIDVTQSHQMSKNLQRMQEMLTQTNLMAKVGGWEVDLIEKRIYWSEVTRHIHGVNPDFRPDMETSKSFYKEGESIDKLTTAFNRAITEGTSYDLELQMTTANGKEIWVRTIGNSEFENGVCKRLYGTLQDIDQQKKQDQELATERARLLAFVQHAPAAVAMFDKEIRYLAISEKWLEEYKLIGRNIIGMSHYEVFPNIGEDWKTIHLRCLEGEIFKSEEERWLPEGWETDQFLKWEVRPWYQFDGEVGGIMMFTQDITAASLSREELKEAKFQSEQANIAKSEFLANMSHEIRTPLNGVIGFTDLVLKTKMTDTQKQYLGIVNQSANALLNVINDILDFSKIEAGKLELDIEKCDIYEIASKSADIISFPIQSKGLEMLLNIPDNLPRFVWVDDIRLKQVLINLLSNAAKFTEVGEIELKIEILNYDRENNEICCRFIVRDTGIGIKEDKQTKIFEAFLQEDGSTTKKYGGTGLGLTISNKLLGMMGSELKLRSVPGKGSTFFFDLKMKSEEVGPITWDNASTIKKVLIVDNNDNNRIILERMLQLLNIESEQVKSGYEALELLKNHADFDAVFMDYQMPGMDGLETVRKIREQFTKESGLLPIALLSSSADEVTISRGTEEYKINYRLIKPIKLNDIILCLTKLSRKEIVDQEASAQTEKVSEAKLMVLIAEDNPANMFLTKTIIGKMAPKATILEAKNGFEAVKKCSEFLPDIIFMDVQMPEMNGYEATHAIKQSAATRHIPVIALTAGNVKGEREKCLEAGMIDFVTKPFVQESIWQMLCRIPGFSNSDFAVANDIESVEVENERFNIQRLRTAYMDDDEFIGEILSLTRHTLEENLNDLKRICLSPDLAGIKSAAHRLKGVAKAVFLTQVAHFAQELEGLPVYEEQKVRELMILLENEIKIILPRLYEPGMA
jgi:PAS domain S-box-containing protein